MAKKPPNPDPITTAICHCIGPANLHAVVRFDGNVATELLKLKSSFEWMCRTNRTMADRLVEISLKADVKSVMLTKTIPEIMIGDDLYFWRTTRKLVTVKDEFAALRLQLHITADGVHWSGEVPYTGQSFRTVGMVWPDIFKIVRKENS